MTDSKLVIDTPPSAQCGHCVGFMELVFHGIGEDIDDKVFWCPDCGYYCEMENGEVTVSRIPHLAK